MNKSTIKYYFLSLLFAVFLLGSCNKMGDFGNLNTDPKRTTIPVTSALLTNSLSSLGNIPTNTNIGYYVQNYSELTYPNNSLYATTAVSWDGFYSGVLEDLQMIIQTCKDNPTQVNKDGTPINQIQIARILKVYFFSIMTDRYGDVPYTEALRGLAASKYDKQKDIYIDFFKELREANAAFIDPTNPNYSYPIAGDIIYGGDIDKWKKLSNTLRLIFAIRLSKVDPTWGKEEYNLALNDPAGLISNNEDNFMITYDGTNFTHPYYNLTGASLFGITKTVTDKLGASGYNDPRLAVYAQPRGGTAIKGVPFGIKNEDLTAWLIANPDYSLAFNSNFKLANSKSYVFPAAYTNLLRAEGSIIYNAVDVMSPIALLQKGIEDSWSQWGIATTNVPTYLSRALSVNANDTLKTIREQVWIALYGNTMNAWNEWRRTGVPSLTPAPAAINATRDIPRRYQYPLTEANLNSAGYNGAAGSFPYGGADVHSNRVWWDKL